MNTAQIIPGSQTGKLEFLQILTAVHAAQMEDIRDAVSTLTVIAMQLQAYAEAGEPLPTDALAQLCSTLTGLPEQLKPLSLDDARDDGSNIIDLDIERARRHWGA